VAPDASDRGDQPSSRPTPRRLAPRERSPTDRTSTMQTGEAHKLRAGRMPSCSCGIHAGRRTHEPDDRASPWRVRPWISSRPTLLPGWFGGHPPLAWNVRRDDDAYHYGGSQGEERGATNDIDLGVAGTWPVSDICGVPPLEPGGSRTVFDPVQLALAVGRVLSCADDEWRATLVLDGSLRRLRPGGAALRGARCHPRARERTLHACALPCRWAC
jgi:hypothetical protein